MGLSLFEPLSRACAQRVYRQHELRDRLATNKMLLNDPLQYCGSRRMIPDALRVDHGDGTLFADLQTVRLGAENAVLSLRQTCFDQALLKKLPRRVTDFAGRTLWLCLSSAQKDVPAKTADAKQLSFFSNTLKLDAWSRGFVRAIHFTLRRPSAGLQRGSFSSRSSLHGRRTRKRGQELRSLESQQSTAW